MNTTKTRDYFADQGIKALKADKTTDAPEIDQLLKALGNSNTQIPFYAVFPADTPNQPQTYSGLFFSADHFLNEIRGVASTSSWKSWLLWGLVAAAVGIGGVVFLRRQSSSNPHPWLAEQAESDQSGSDSAS